MALLVSGRLVRFLLRLFFHALNHQREVRDQRRDRAQARQQRRRQHAHRRHAQGDLQKGLSFFVLERDAPHVPLVKNALYLLHQVLAQHFEFFVELLFHDQPECSIRRQPAILSPMAEKLGLRDRKKKDTRRLILQAANALFHDRGFAATKLEDIAARAGIHKQTVLRYFGSKEAIALAFRQVALDKFKAGLLDPAREVPVLEYWRNFIEASAREVTQRGDLLRYTKLVESEPALMGASLAIHMQYEDLLAAALSREAGRDPDQDLHSRLLAAFLVAGHFNVARHCLNRGRRKDYVRIALSVVDLGIRKFPHAARDGTRKSVTR